MKILDNNYLGITSILTIGMQLLFFAIAATFKFDKVTDLAGSSNFVLLALFTLGVNNTLYHRQVVNTALVGVWGVRLGGFLLWRVIKVMFDNLLMCF